MSWKTINLSKGWLPDFPPQSMPEGGLVVAKNIIPLGEGYTHMPNKIAYSSEAITDATGHSGSIPLKGKAFGLANGQNRLLVGTTKGIVRLDADLGVTSLLSGLTLGSGVSWSFAQYGDWVVAVVWGVAPQKCTDITSGTFGDLAGSPPKAKYCTMCRGHLVLAHLQEGATVKPKKVKWSASENIEDWTASLITKCGSQILYDADGGINGIMSVGGNLCICHEDSATLGFYTGGMEVFQFVANKARGVRCIENTPISAGNVGFFWSEDDIWKVDHSGEITPIGLGIRKHVLRNLDLDNAYRISASVDPHQVLGYWAYPSSSSTSNCDKILVYNYKVERFTILEVPTRCIFHFQTPKVTIDDTMFQVGGTFADLDKVPYSLDSSFWSASTFEFGCVDNTDEYVDWFAGEALEGELETGDHDFGSVVMVNQVRPNIDLPTDPVKVQMGARFTQDAYSEFNNEVTMGTNGYCDFRRSGRYVRFRMKFKKHRGLGLGLGANIIPMGVR